MDWPWESPGSWEWTALGEVVEIVRQQVDPGLFPGEPFNYLSIENVESNTGRLVNFRPTLGKEIRSAKLAFTTHDLLYAKLRPYLNKVHLPHFDGVSATDLIPLRPLDEIAREYVAYYLRCRYVVEYANQRMRGIQLPRLPVDDLKELPFPLAPLSEQRRIVAKIDVLLEKSRAAREAMDRVPGLLRRFRQSVLAKAFRGELTEREPGGEAADDLLQQIATERRQQGLKIPESEWYPSDFQKWVIPPGWSWAKIGDIAESALHGPALSKKKYDRSGVVVIRITDLGETGQVIPNNPPRMVLPSSHVEKLRLKTGDILVARDASIGKCAVFENFDEPAVFPNHLIRLRFPTGPISPKYVLNYLLSQMGQRLLFQGASAGAGRPSLKGKTLCGLPIPLPPGREQGRMVRKIESLISYASALQAAAQGARGRLEKLEQAVLAQAFRGELVAQDPNDEPASMLVERIRAWRLVSHSRPRSGVRRQPASSG